MRGKVMPDLSWLVIALAAFAVAMIGIVVLQWRKPH